MIRTVRVFATSDLITDQRVHKTATSLAKCGYRVIVTGRKPNITANQTHKLYRVEHINCIVSKGVVFYLLFNVRIFVALLFKPFDAIYANDLDTLPGCWLASIIRWKPLIYDSHELFPEVPELIGHRFKKRIWTIAERICIKRARCVFTVSDSIAQEFHKNYGVMPTVLRNLPYTKDVSTPKNTQPTIIYQGALNVGRGIELAIDAMNYLENYKLIIAGTGDIELDLKKRVNEQNLDTRIEFVGRLSPADLHKLTCTAWLGISLEEDMGLNYRYALPNKLFDYIAAHVPVMVSDLPEMRKIVTDYGVGLVVENRVPQKLATQIRTFIENHQNWNQAEQNTRKAALELNWKTEEQKLIATVKQAIEQ